MSAGKWYPWATLTAENRRRPLDWRWLRARQIVSTGKKNGGRFEDPIVNRACNLLAIQNDEAGLASLGETAARRSSPDSIPSEDLTEDDRIQAELPDLYDAHIIHTYDLTTRWQMEAMILSGENTQYIANQTSANAKAVGVYEQLFFDVRDRLKASAFIAGQVLDSASRHDIPVGDPDKWWKVLGYQGYRLGVGSGLLAAFWDFDMIPDEVQDWYYRVVESNLAKQSAAFTATVRINPEVANFFLQNFWSARKIRMDQEKSSSNSAQLGSDMDSKRSLLESMSMTVSSVVGDNKIKAAEPRTKDVTQSEIAELSNRLAEDSAAVESKTENDEEE